ncbi:hypothetical protein TNCV_4842561 [Trichonephila clavipes]|uniref:Uncharacterized protein n=1 Tax=Trichonephila clavipes TaxID=2585209 RepID=A0A8X7BL21_TRICX|nr:hypothetical protein TNCV_4842561 [Trichonephila clavipes]
MFFKVDVSEDFEDRAQSPALRSDKCDARCSDDRRCEQECSCVLNGCPCHRTRRRARLTISNASRPCALVLLCASRHSCFHYDDAHRIGIV